jgi:hypothetical protein
MLQLVVPLEKPLPPRSFLHVTAVTPLSSDDLPPSVTTDDPVEYVPAEVGPRISIEGRVVSPVL